MNSNIVRFVLYSLLILTLQIWVLGSISLFRVAIPFVYPLTLLLLPISTGTITLTLIGFGIGVALDILFQTPGLHTTAMVVVGFVRNYLLHLFVDKEMLPIEPPLFPTLRGRAVLLWGILLLIHHLVLYLLDAWSMVNWSTLGTNLLFGWLISFIIGQLILSLLSLGYRSPARHG